MDLVAQRGRSKSRTRIIVAGILTLGLLLLRPTVASAAEMAEGEVAFILNTFSFLVWAALVMWMCAGFTMLESGAVRTKNSSMICLKNIGIYSIACLAFYVIGYNLMYVDVGNLIGSFQLFYSSSPAEIDLLSGADAVGDVVSNGYSVLSDWFFQMVFVATTASIVSGAIAERAKLWPFFGFTLVLAAFIYPIVGAWTWGGGWLAEMGFSDFAGSTIVHSVGGWAALAGVLVIGPRLGKYRKDGSVKPTPPSNVLAVTLGVFILWLGWFGFNGGSQLALGSALDAVAMGTVLVNTNLAACAGVLAALAVSRPLLGRIDLFAGLNGAIAGLVSITAAPTHNDLYWAIIIGAVGGVLCTLGIRGLEKVRVDDVVGAIPAHLVCGIWGTLAATIASPDTNFGVQLVGIIAVGVFVFAVSWVVWTFLDRTIGLRVSVQAEQMGQDVAELGMESYPEFVLMPENFDDDE
ncbi:MAG: ammonium transporter [bacterium]|nr:ammonium transporter [bacterium]MYB45913.1 ammonium transporter [Acidimicrobiia bacterium]